MTMKPKLKALLIYWSCFIICLFALSVILMLLFPTLNRRWIIIPFGLIVGWKTGDFIKWYIKRKSMVKSTRLFKYNNPLT